METSPGTGWQCVGSNFWRQSGRICSTGKSNKRSNCERTDAPMGDIIGKSTNQHEPTVRRCSHDGPVGFRTGIRIRARTDALTSIDGMTGRTTE